MKRSILLCELLALAAGVPAAAATLTYSDRGTWASQVTGMTNFDSGTQTAGTVTTFNNAAGLAIADLQIVGYNVTTGTSYDLARVNANASQTWYQWGSGAILRTGDKTASNTVYARINFPTAVSAFGFNFGAGGSGGAPGSVTIQADGMSAVTVNTLQQPTFAFWGVTSDTRTFSFANVFINDTNRYLILDDIAKGSFAGEPPPPPPPPTEVMEPGTLMQLLMGTGLLAFSRRKRTSGEDQTA